MILIETKPRQLQLLHFHHQQWSCTHYAREYNLNSVHIQFTKTVMMCFRTLHCPKQTPLGPKSVLRNAKGDKITRYSQMGGNHYAPRDEKEYASHLPVFRFIHDILRTNGRDLCFSNSDTETRSEPGKSWKAR